MPFFKSFSSQLSPNWFRISKMVLDQIQIHAQTQSPSSSIFACSVCSGFHLLSFLLTCSALLLATFAFSLLKTSPSAPHTNPDSKQNHKEEAAANEDHHACDSLLSSSAEGEWPSEEDDDLDLTQECSDGSISDEESLIEITLPNGYYMEPKKQRFWSEQQSLMMELLAEINEMAEEENMIEIDISMGSIMCPRFEIKA